MSGSAAPENVVLIELNEVPNAVLDAYAEHRSPSLKKILSESDRYVTVTPDQIQLDPWIAWPTFHRGVNDEAHGLLRLGQDTSRADEAYPPIWRTLSDAGVSTGVYGSLFSSCEEDLSPYTFFVPDVFSPHDRVKPEDLRQFQNFNLAMTRQSARNASSNVSAGGGRAVGALALSGRLTPGTIARAASQVLSERITPRNVSRRRNTQTEFHADVFASLLKRDMPQFSTFYTNNVAAAMHRFWSAGVPDAILNREKLKPEWLDAYADEVFLALASVERLIARITSGEFGPLTLVVASALGQEEIPAENHSSFLTVADLDIFARAVLGDAVPDVQFTSVPTMVPDFSLRFPDVGQATRFVERLKLLKIGEIAPVETFERMLHKELVNNGPRLSHIRHSYAEDTHFKHVFTYKRSDDHNIHISLQADDYNGAREVRLGNETLSFEQAGIGFVSHDEGVNCTAQHCAEGSLFVHRAGGRASKSGMKSISILDFAPSLLDHFGLAAPSYLQGHTTIELGSRRSVITGLAA
jgi:hypothetical protein